MTIVVVGAGAIGQLVAGRLAETSHGAVLLARPRVAMALKQQPVQILQGGRLHVADHLTTIIDPAALESSDQRPELAILCVKAYDTIGALPTLAALNAQTILTLQNGIGNEAILAEQFGVERIVSGAITISVELAVSGCVKVVKRGGIGLTPLSPAAQPAADRALTMLRDAGFDTRAYANYRALKWSKALLNMLGNATAAILDMPVWEIYADPRLIALERRASLEALAVMDQLGIEPVNLPRYPAALLAGAMRWMPAALLNPLLRRKLAGGRGGKPPSLQIDLARGNQRSEGKFLYGAVARAGAEAGVSTPINRALWATLRAIATGEVAWETYRRKPERLLELVAGDRASVIKADS